MIENSAEGFSDTTLKRADLHCHSRFSVFKYFRRANTRDCYNAPEDVYRIAKERGMSYVTLTDHDSIEGALYLLNKHPDMNDFFIGEEVETYFPETGQRIHVGVWGLESDGADGLFCGGGASVTLRAVRRPRRGT